LQRCHVCGRTNETCKPCPYCNWWFCEQHLDPEQHDCTGLKALRKTDYSKVKLEETVKKSTIQRWREKALSLFLELGILLLALAVIFGARTSPYMKVQAGEELCHKTLALEPFSIKWFEIEVIPRLSTRMENLSLRIAASEQFSRKFSLKVYVLTHADERRSFLEWWFKIKEQGYYKEPNFTKPLYEAEDVSRVAATVPVNKSGLFGLYYVFFNWNLFKNVSVTVSSSLVWLKPGYVNLSYSLDSPGLYAGFPLLILDACLLIRRGLGGRFPKFSRRWTMLSDALIFAAILLLPFVLYFSTEGDLNNAIVFLFNSYNPIDALSPESLAIYAIALQSILLHEYGHFAAARAAGLKAEIRASEEPNALAVTRVSTEKPMTMQDVFRIRRMGPLSNLLLIIVNIPLFLLYWRQMFGFAALWNLIVLSWNAKELSAPPGYRRKLVKDARILPEIAEKYVKRVEDKLGVKLDYSLESLKNLGNVTSRLLEDIKGSRDSVNIALALYALSTASYIGEVIVRNKNGKWVEADNRLGWAVRFDSKEVDVLQMVIEGFLTPERFNELLEKLKSM